MKACILLLGIALLIVACSEPEPEPELANLNPYFPQMQTDPQLMLEALIVGELVAENGCLRVKTADGDSRLLIWTNAAEMIGDAEGVRIKDVSGSDVALYVGVKVGFGGAGVIHPPPAHIVAALTALPIPSNCPGPYWTVHAIAVRPE